MTTRFKSRYDRWLWPVLLIVPGLPLGRAGTLVASDELQLAWFMVGVAGFALLVLWFVLP